MCGAPRSWTNTSIGGILAKERARHACVIQMDVREENLADVADRDALSTEGLLQAGVGRRWSGIDQRNAGGAVENGGRDDLRDAQKVQIDVVKSGGKRQHG